MPGMAPVVKALATVVRSVITGRNAVPIVVLSSAMLAVRIFCCPASPPLVRAKSPCASAVCRHNLRLCGQHPLLGRQRVFDGLSMIPSRTAAWRKLMSSSKML